MLARARTRVLALARARVLALARVLARVWVLALARTRVLALARARTLALARARTLENFGNQKLKRCTDIEGAVKSLDCVHSLNWNLLHDFKSKSMQPWHRLWMIAQHAQSVQAEVT